MNERYTRLFEGDHNLFCPSSPVIINANVLLRDNSSGALIAQMKFRNISEKSVTFLRVRLELFDALKASLGTEDFDYNNLSVNSLDQFGQKTPVFLANTSVRSYKVCVTGVAFSDGTFWRNDSYDWIIDNEVEKEAGMHRVYLEAVFVMNAANTESAYKAAADTFRSISGFKDADALAEQCLDKAEVCRKNTIYASAHTKQIKNSIAGCESAIKLYESISGWKDADEQIYVCQRKIEEIKAKEEADRLERERQAEQRRIAAKKVAKRLKVVSTIVLVCAACIAFIVLLSTVIIPTIQYNALVDPYNAAIDLLNAGDYAGARSAFLDLNGFLDSPDRVTQCEELLAMESDYNAAVELYNAGKYDAAISAFRALNGFRDSSAQITRCETSINDSKYDAAVALYNAGKYDEAMTAFTALKGYKDSEAQITKCETAINDAKYNAAVALYNAGKYDEAITAFTALKGYKDSEAQITKCETAITDAKYNAAVALIEKGDIINAYDGLIALNGYKDSTQKANDIFSKYKMAKLKAASVGDIVCFGSYEQDNNKSNGKEDIKWLVLAKEGNKALVISKYALDSQKYNTSYTTVTWETCSLRKWLNGTFLSAAFSSEEQNSIISSTVTADKNPSYITSPGNNTTDKVFLLSITEVNKYFSSDSARQCQGTAYCYAQGADKDRNGNCWWWLRSPGYLSDRAAGVYHGGSVYDDGYYVSSARGAVRPALWINLGS